MQMRHPMQMRQVGVEGEGEEEEREEEAAVWKVDDQGQWWGWGWGHTVSQVQACRWAGQQTAATFLSCFFFLFFFPFVSRDIRQLPPSLTPAASSAARSIPSKRKIPPPPNPSHPPHLYLFSLWFLLKRINILEGIFVVGPFSPRRHLPRLRRRCRCFASR